MESLEAWLHRQYWHAAGAMLRSVSPVHLVKTRPGFGQTIRPKKGAIVASPVMASWDPDPDYFFHWFRDSAVVIDALRVLFKDGTVGAEALTHFADFVRFSLALQQLNGRTLVTSPAWRTKVSADFAKYLRSDESLSSVDAGNVAADTRVNADGTLDISSWSRPQNDGPAMRVLALLRWSESASFDAALGKDVSALLSFDLAFVLKQWRNACFDIWEEEIGLHYYTLCVSAAALEQGAAWLDKQGGDRDARSQSLTCRAEAAAIRQMLDGYWLADAGYYRSRVLDSSARSTKELDIAVILAAIHACDSGARHSVTDPKMHATLARLEALFDGDYGINRGRPSGRGPAMGRYAGDAYFSGGAYYFSTLGAAEFCFLAAASVRAGGGTSAAHGLDPPSLIQRGDAYLETVRAFTPADGAMSEQFDQKTGAQTSAKELAWSYAAFISCVAARRAATA